MGAEELIAQPTPPKRILGVDPGLNTTGYAVIENQTGRSQPSVGSFSLIEAGVIRSRRREPLSMRLKEIHDGISEVLAAHAIDMLALEQLFSHYDRPRTAILMGHARGVICLAAGCRGVSIEHFEPTRVKKLITGNGRAPKHQIQQAIQLQLGLPSLPEPADVADAMAIALCGHALAHNPLATL